VNSDGPEGQVVSAVLFYLFYYQYLKKSIDLSKCSREISNIVPLSSDVEQRPMFISVPVPGINNNTAMIINIKTL
jgi:hypothetical protein